MNPTQLDVTPNTPEWLAARASFRTASELPIVTGTSPFTSREKFKLIKVGLAKQYYSKAMQQGHETEAATRAWANAHFNLDFQESVWFKGAYLASLDGYDAGVIIEIKCSTRTYDEVAAGNVPVYYHQQILQQLYCSGADKAYLVAFCPKTNRYTVSDAIFPDPDFRTWADAAWEAFDAMPIPEGPIEADDNLALLREFEQYATLKREAERIAAEMDEVKERILAYKAPGRNVKCNGYEIVAKAGASRVDYKKAATDAKLDLTPYKTQGEATYMLKMAPSPFEADDNE